MNIRPYLATFYRGRWLYLAALLLLLGASAVGTYYLARSQYEATARIWTEQPVLDNVLNQNASQGYAPPAAQQQADKLNQLLQTDSFMVGVLKGTSAAPRLAGVPDEDHKLITTLRKNLGVTALGANTIMITYRGKDPVFSQQMVQGTLDQFRSWSLTTRIEQNSLELQFYQKQLKIYEDQMNEAANRLDQFQRQYPFPDPTSPQYLDLQRLQRELETSRGLYNTTRAKIEQANAVETLADSSRQTEFQVLDQPTVPRRPWAPLSRLAKYIGLGVAASFGLVLAAVVLATWQDTAVRTADDLRRLSDAPVLAAIPHLDLRLLPQKGDRRPREAPPAAQRPVPAPSAEKGLGA